MDPARLRELAAAEDEEGERAWQAGDRERAERLWDSARERVRAAERMEERDRERLPARVRDANDMRMTNAQQRRRGEAIARGKATSAIAQAITSGRDSRGRQWTITSYAGKRLGVSQPSLSRYLRGSLDCPPEVADKVRADFGLGDDAWPRPPRR